MCTNLYGGAWVDRPTNTKDKAAAEVWHILAADENPLIDVVPEVNLFIRLWDEYIWKLWTFTSDNCSVTDWWMFNICYCCWVSLIGDCRESFEHLIRDTKQQIHMRDSLNFVIYVFRCDSISLHLLLSVSGWVGQSVHCGSLIVSDLEISPSFASLFDFDDDACYVMGGW